MRQTASADADQPTRSADAVAEISELDVPAHQALRLALPLQPPGRMEREAQPEAELSAPSAMECSAAPAHDFAQEQG